jgi:hypothetical protein
MDHGRVHIHADRPIRACMHVALTHGDYRGGGPGAVQSDAVGVLFPPKHIPRLSASARLGIGGPSRKGTGARSGRMQLPGKETIGCDVVACAYREAAPWCSPMALL